MKTLILSGAARKNGHTAQMVDRLAQAIGGECEVIDIYRLKGITPCMDCRYCWKHPQCCIQDSMQEIYRKVEQADCIVLASPIYFHSVSGVMKTLLDRFQVYWASSVRKDRPQGFLHKGAILMVGGAPSFENQFLGGEIVLKNVLNDLSAEYVGKVCLPNSDRDSLETRPDIAQQIDRLALALRGETV